MAFEMKEGGKALSKKRNCYRDGERGRGKYGPERGERYIPFIFYPAPSGGPSSFIARFFSPLL